MNAQDLTDLDETPVRLAGSELQQLIVTNSHTAVQYIKVYDQVLAPDGSDVPGVSIPIAPDSTVQVIAPFIKSDNGGNTLWLVGSSVRGAGLTAPTGTIDGVATVRK